MEVSHLAEMSFHASRDLQWNFIYLQWNASMHLMQNQY